MSKLYKTFRNVEEKKILVKNTLREIKNTEKEWRENNIILYKIKDKINPLLNNFPNIDINKIIEINDSIINIIDRFNIFEIKEKKSKINKEEMRLDILLILDISKTMSSYLKDLKNNLKTIIDSIKEDFPLTIVKIGFIGYKDFKDLEFGVDYIDIDFLIDYNKLIQKIEEIDDNGGGSKSKDVASAFKLALRKSWGKGKKLAILITNSPYQENEYHINNEDKFTDRYNEQNNAGFERKKLKDYLQEFIKENIYLIGYDISEKTKTMYNKFQEFYEGKFRPALFSKEKGELKDIIYNKVKYLLKDQKKEVMNI